MKFVKYSKDKKGLEKLMKEDQSFMNLSRKTANLLNIITSSDFKYDNTKESVNMCQAIEDMKKDAVDQGISQGIKVSKYLMKNYTQQKKEDDIINELVNEFNISTDDAKIYLNDFLS